MQKVKFIFVLLQAFCMTFFTKAQDPAPDSLHIYLETVKEDSTKIKLLNINTRKYMFGPDYRIGLQYANEALLLSQKTKNKKGEALAFNNLGAINYLHGNFAEALKNYFASIKISETVGDKRGIADVYSNIASIYSLQGKYNDALKNDTAALKIRLEIGDRLYIAGAYNNVAETYHSMGNNTESLKNHLASLKIKKEIDDKQGLATSYSNIGNIYFEEANKEHTIKRNALYDEALKNQLLSLKMREEMKDQQGIAESEINLGGIYLKLDRKQEAKKYLEDALIVSKKIGYKEAIKDIYGSMSELDSLNGDWKQAYLHHTLYTTMKDSILNEASSGQIAEMQTKYETEKKEKENTLLTKQNEINNLEIDRQKNQRNILLISIVSLLFLGGLIFNRIRLKQKNKILIEKELRNRAVFKAQEEEKTRLSKELHDGVGPLLSLIKLSVSSLDKNPDNEKMLEEIKSLASEGIKEVRTISHALMPSLLEKKGLEPALKDFIEQINLASSLKTELKYSIRSLLPYDTSVNLYRIAQEGLTNILKHSGAGDATVDLSENEQKLQLIISDNGKGFDPANLANGNGLNNIYSRVDFLKGEIALVSKPGKGSTFTIFIPK